MANIPIIGAAGCLSSYLTAHAVQWPTGQQRSGAYVTAYGLGAFSSHSAYPSSTELAVRNSERRLHLSVWLRRGINVDIDGWKFRIEGHDTVAGYLPGAPWQTDLNGDAHHVGLLLHAEAVRALAGEQGEAFLEGLRRNGFLRVQPGDAAVLRAAHELDVTLLALDSSALLREAKSLELLARLVEAGTRQDRFGLTRADRTRLDRARALLLADLAHPPTIAQLACACGLNTLRLKRGFKQRFGLPVYSFYQHERMRAAWELIASGRMNVTEAGHHLGYTNMSHFGTAFQRIYGILPSQLKRSST
jgi:AraC family transcriptional regulator